MIIGVGGCSCSGKTTLSKRLKEVLQAEGFDVAIVNQDEYYKSPDLDHWEDPETINMDEFKAKILEENAKAPDATAKCRTRIVIAEGFLVYCLERSFFDVAFFVTAPYDILKARREKRNDWMEWKDPEGYFEKEVYPSYQKYNEHVINSRNGEYVKLDGSEPPDDIAAKAMDVLHAEFL